MAIIDWRALLVGGKVVDRQEVQFTSNLPPFTVRELEIRTDSPHIPSLRIQADPTIGQSIRLFTRHSVRLGAKGDGERARDAVPVIEIIPDPEKPQQFVRLYLTDGGPILSTSDLTL